MIRQCFPCRPGPAATYQDKQYGQGMRVHTWTQKDPKNVKYRCTVCGKEK